MFLMICLVDWENLYIFAGKSFQKWFIVNCIDI